MCHFETGVGAGKVCTASGDMPACQLCPRSPTYWRNTAAPPSPTPWDGTPKTPVAELDMTGWRDERVGNAAPCVLCNIHTTWISPKGKRCHPSCARLHLRRTTGPGSAQAPL